MRINPRTNRFEPELPDGQVSAQLQRYDVDEELIIKGYVFRITAITDGAMALRPVRPAPKPKRSRRYNPPVMRRRR
jgi:hypothetical protein